MNGASWSQGVLRWLAPEAPARRLALVRIAVLSFACIWLLAMAPDLLVRARLSPDRFVPVGLAVWTGPVAPALVTTAWVATLGLGLLAAAGIGYRALAPAFALGLTWLLSYRNSWGHMSHAEHLLVLQVAIVALAPAADALRLRGRRPEPAPPDARYGWPLRLILLVTISTYVIAGLAKLRTGGLGWLAGDALRLHVAHEVLRTSLVGASGGTVARWLLPHAWVFGAMAVATVVIELGAVLALRDGWPRYGWILAAWCMHLGIWAVMGIGFPYPISGVAWVGMLEVERGLDWARRRRRAPS
ncbi:MAG: hypothetical protein AB1Z98_11400 [Nannocystaceae bacterium]